jgi:hypothetical protein
LTPGLYGSTLDKHFLPKDYPVLVLTAVQCRELADDHKARARAVGISQKRATLLANIAKSYSGLASQLEMLADDNARTAATTHKLVPATAP